MLTQLKDSMGLQHGISTSLDSKLNASLASIEAGDYGAAADQLESFVNEVAFLVGCDSIRRARPVRRAKRQQASGPPRRQWFRTARAPGERVSGMKRSAISQMPVFSGGKKVGTISDGNVTTLLPTA
ncbi:MAG: hypothetical protein JRM76_08350 [Nitrososphaerota archaeon]|nr:hypothetical protein [Nitrososphaerota archaeon]MDG6993234.1 hypothetical protein [Nitrososphaerota archaeon]